jgi:hypothetical protein
MMERLLSVTYGYLKFTFVSMMVAASVFTLAGLAPTSPTYFVAILALGFLLFLTIRSEAKTKRRHQELRQQQKSEDLTPESLAQWLAFVQATSLLSTSITDAIPGKALPLLVLDWSYNSDPKLVTVATPMGQPFNEKVKIAFAAAALQRHQGELIKHGFTPVFISTKPAEQILKSLWDKHPDQYGPSAAGYDEKLISIGFVQHKKTAGAPATVLARILNGSLILISSANSPELKLHFEANRS